MMRHCLLLVALSFALAAAVSAQGSPEKKPSFEVASIKPNKETSGGSWSTSGGRQTIIGTTATVLIMSAFNVHDYEVIGAPSWSDSERLDVIVQAEGKPTREESCLMMQSLLEERFALKAHRETREGPVYRLVLAKKDGTLGPQLLKTTSECGDKPPASVPWALQACRARTSLADMIMGATLFSGLTTALESLVDRRIIDETGLSGRFDVKLEWSRGQSDVERPSIFTAIQEQLGLKLEPARGPISVVVIDSISRPTPD
jgi:uncharacterized protein (TIGR03435 family)